MPPRTTIKDLFENDKKRVDKMSKRIDVMDQFLQFDYSKTHLDDAVIKKYYEKFQNINLKKSIEHMFTGEKINYTENREVLHVALRDKRVISKFEGDKETVLNFEYAEIYNELNKMADLSKLIEEEKLVGASNKVIDTIVHIGIGGSDLGPRMVCEALHFYRIRRLNVHFISNVDATEALQVFDKINPEKTLFIVVSKSFTTPETLENARLVKQMFLKSVKLDEKLITQHHFIAVSSNKAEVEKFGIKTVFSMWDFVGGRYSIWSAAGLTICLYIGFKNFLKFLKGASIMDEHFLNSGFENNIPIFHAIIELYYNNELGFNNKCVLAYDQYLSKLPSYLQQAEMESNGKSARRPEVYHETENLKSQNDNTGMIIWGDVGTNCQHSFFQLIHQGTRDILCEFIVGLKALGVYCETKSKHHKILFANCIAQTEALMNGRKNDDKNRNFDGDKPSIIVAYSQLTPEVLGALIALYEHKIFVQGLMWGINSFDQFGVELGKILAKEIFTELNGDKVSNRDDSTKRLIELRKKHEKTPR
ncbi:hypothetical protein EDEG_00087 [Edhazardia aedis USNM 41457]|uniref:Glucose-6-phosphate isomerase n=1 Tax=Edhazardia aedis (strain USNM 41457) TaxID=1003232 RepID=J9DQX0_EDHAE|nr:hypothetical protein EDEG_00087 [Edhazardia aedis USNM 41457]|eukprot:EJW04970.1 hypothetical protein EDEG_00087 [Edhazardia aedis USNM 41457]